ncbi:MAG TPA: C4-type zinc ribbon domain-containing protein [Stackebrandtia sp.]|uniref:zinc ribbon domain-containing protein n=1 Tax=Stackebrandtia sp. TaxID=2023065 RepID=UPI002D24BD10|nr:C4-type zinc ribbon domain-containing protein [Stackebrandtia sp.]HZE39964.1 C4-type zinc ribbon domain-containing protein [Stackebrandtia sp.]
MHAEPADQRRLLDLQQADTSLTQLTHRRTHLPEEAEIAELRGRVTGLTDTLAGHQAGASDLERDISRVEREIEQVRARADKDRARQTSSAVGAKELEGLGHELETLARRQSELEDQELELMERRETELSAAAGQETGLAEAKTALAEAERRKAEALGQIDLELAAQNRAREEISASVPAELLGLYDKIRRNQPIAAALLRRRRCESCRLEQSGGELAALRAAEDTDVVRCDNCGAILIRTEDSGL